MFNNLCRFWILAIEKVFGCVCELVCFQILGLIRHELYRTPCVYTIAPSM